ncbi:hypothetical protein PDIDSM_8986 [Penicillium digitatum]|nr:hypothetical protein PDIDSM_8986 [Penicillium digitatum]
MSTNSESDYFDDDDFVVPGTPDGSSRPAKRRRIRNRGKEREGDDNGSSINSFSDMEDDDLLSGYRESPPGFDEYRDRPKNKSCVLKQATIQNNMFVTQLTQPSSSPERIRGPRWQKPVAKPSQPKFETREQDSGASLDSFEEEKNKERPSGPQVYQKILSPKRLPPLEKTNSRVSVDIPFELEDIPEGAFDSSPSLSPVARPVQPAVPQFNHPEAIRQPL